MYHTARGFTTLFEEKIRGTEDRHPHTVIRLCCFTISLGKGYAIKLVYVYTCLYRFWGVRPRDEGRRLAGVHCWAALRGTGSGERTDGITVVLGEQARIPVCR